MNTAQWHAHLGVGLSHGGILSAGTGLLVAAIAVLAIMTGTVAGFGRVAAVLTVVGGGLQAWLGARIALDGQLFRALVHTSAEDDLRNLDNALDSFINRPAESGPRSVAERVQGLSRLVRFSGFTLATQLLLVISVVWLAN